MALTVESFVAENVPVWLATVAAAAKPAVIVNGLVVAVRLQESHATSETRPESSWMEETCATILQTTQAVPAAFGTHESGNYEEESSLGLTVEGGLDSIGEAFFAPGPVGQTSQELDLFELPEVVDGNGFWSMAAADTQFWFDGSDMFSDFLSLEAPSVSPEQELAQPILSLSTKMQDWFSATSRPSSPSRNRIRKMWYSGMPDHNHYKKEVKEVFLRLFMKHIPYTFPLFDRKHSFEHQRPAMYVLAMAAVGGLFCSVPGSSEVARSMCNDARRLVLADYNMASSANTEEASVGNTLASLNTMILLGIYGVCSGDKRSYEFYEAFYGDMSNVVTELAAAIQADQTSRSWDTQIALSLGALYVIDSYRVTIMLRPSLMPWWGLEPVIANSPPETELAALLSKTHHLWRGSTLKSELSSGIPGLEVLCSFAPHVWTAMCADHSPDVGEGNILGASPLDQLSFAELACEQWLHEQPDSGAQSSHLAVYHMMKIILHGNVKMLQTFAHSPPTSPARDQKRSIVARELYRWAESRHRRIVEWHAKSLMTVIETSVARRSPSNTPRLATTPSYISLIPEGHESPHVPYAVYFAAVVLWCIGMVDNRSISETELRAPIIRAERLLLLHKVHVAKNLIRALRSIR